MAALSNYLSNALLNQTFRGTTYTFPSTLYVALVTTAPTATSTGTSIVEPSGNGYARVAITVGTSAFSASTVGSTNNSATITFPASTGSWGTVVDAVLCDAATTGNMLMFGALGASVAIPASTTYSFSATNFTVTLS